MKNGLSTNINLDGNSELLESFEKSSYRPLADKIVEAIEELDPGSNSDEETNNDNYNDRESDSESDISTLKRLIKIERQNPSTARAELCRERASSAAAAEEAMAVILRLQNEKSLIELDSSQYKRLAEEKQIHDQKVIRSLQWLVWRHESDKTLLEHQLKLCRQKLRHRDQSWDEPKPEEAEEAQSSSFNGGSIWDALENVLYSSREAASALSSP